jgi:hypothetical protein
MPNLTDGGLFSFFRDTAANVAGVTIRFSRTLREPSSEAATRPLRPFSPQPRLRSRTAFSIFSDSATVSGMPGLFPVPEPGGITFVALALGAFAIRRLE